MTYNRFYVFGNYINWQTREKLGEIKKEIDVTFDPNNPDFKNIGTIKIYVNDNLVVEEPLAILEDLKKTPFIEVFFNVLKEVFIIP